MDTTWIQVITIVGANFALVIGMVGSILALYMHSNRESKSDYNKLEAKLELWREETNKMMSDFHGRLCKIESEKRKGEK